jgi:hypothetical protein
LAMSTSEPLVDCQVTNYATTELNALGNTTIGDKTIGNAAMEKRDLGDAGC